MSKRLLLWLVPGLFYSLFVIWYTDFGGPLSATEIEDFTHKLEQTPVTPQQIMN
ncbi:MAG: hypothetical protein O7F73_02275 [Gammaproteobacteria bacterium]|nr:hypothetical protein [Gammaproteobacteria bacterium]